MRINNFQTNIFWSLLGQFGYLGISLIANMILAWLLTPNEFGQFGIVFFFIALTKVLSESGLNGALVRDVNATEEDFSTIFIFNFSISIFLFVILNLSSGFIAEFYLDKNLKNLIMALSFVLLINSFQFVQKAKLVKYMRFRQKAIYEITAVFFSAIVSITLAYNDFGVWSLVIMQLLTSFFTTCLLWIFEGGHGNIRFNSKSLRNYYKFGINTTLASILNTVFDNIYHLILGKFFSISITGFYYQAKKLQEVPVGIVNNLTQSVLFSELAGKQNDKIVFLKTYINVIRIFTLLVGFICLVTFLFSKEIVIILLGKQWLNSIFYIKVLSIVSFFTMQEMFNRILFKIFNETKYILILETIKKVIQSISILFGIIHVNIDFLLYGLIITSVFSFLINFYVSRNRYSFIGFEELHIIIKILILMYCVYSVLSYLKINTDNIFLLIFSLCLTLIIYLVGAILFKLIDNRIGVFLPFVKRKK